MTVQCSVTESQLHAAVESILHALNGNQQAPPPLLWRALVVQCQTWQYTQDCINAIYALSDPFEFPFGQASFVEWTPAGGFVGGSIQDISGSFAPYPSEGFGIPAMSGWFYLTGQPDVLAYPETFSPGDNGDTVISFAQVQIPSQYYIYDVDYSANNFTGQLGGYSPVPYLGIYQGLTNPEPPGQIITIPIPPFNPMINGPWNLWPQSQPGMYLGNLTPTPPYYYYPLGLGRILSLF